MSTLQRLPLRSGDRESFTVLLELVVYPAIFALWKWDAEVKPKKIGAKLVS